MQRFEKTFAKNINLNLNFSNLMRFLLILTTKFVCLSTKQLKQIIINCNFQQINNIEMTHSDKQNFNIDNKYNTNKKKIEKRND